MGAFLKTSPQFPLISGVLLASTVLLLIFSNHFYGANAVFDGSEAFLRLPLFENANCTTGLRYDGFLYARCSYYGEFPRDIPNSTEIRELDMDYRNNTIQTLTDGYLARANLPKLVTLGLSNCQIHIIQKGAFLTEPSILQDLSLSFNNIETLDPEVFAGLSELSHLNLAGNPIKRFEANKVFPPSLSSLIILDLSLCQLDSLSDNVFDNLKLDILYLHNNEFKYMSWRTLRNATIKDYLTLFENPWHCDCNVKFLIDILLEKDLLGDPEKNKCATSPNEDYLKGYSWRENERDKFACLPHIEKVVLVNYDEYGNNSEIQDLNMGNQSYLQVGEDVYIKCKFSGYPRPTVQLNKHDWDKELTIKRQVGTESHSVSEKRIGHISNGAEERQTNSQIKQADRDKPKVQLNKNAEADSNIDNEEWRQIYTYEDILVIKNAQKADSGRYSCNASNFAGSVDEAFDLNFTDASGSVSWKIYLGIGVAFPALSVIMLLLWLKFGRRMKWTRFLQRKTIDEAPKENFEKKKDAFEFDRNLELDILSDIFIDVDNILGSGNFGTVYQGRAKGKDVAIKRLNSNTSSATINSLISELKVLCVMGTHKNVVGFIGAYTKEISKGILYIVTELCRNGSLLEFLRKQKDVVFIPTNGYSNIQPNEFVSFKNLCRFASEIASGMEYISAKKVVHGDLSARNVLLDAEHICKIGDFGLARKLYEYQEYVKTSHEPLPWKWMAYESLTKMEFTSKSDVWSYGVTLWEIFSLGNVPFAGLHWTAGFAEKIRNGLHLPVPQHAPNEIYAKMSECWKLDAEERPLFPELETFFRNIEGAHGESSI